MRVALALVIVVVVFAAYFLPVKKAVLGAAIETIAIKSPTAVK